MRPIFRMSVLVPVLLLGCAPSGTHIINTVAGSEEDADKLLIVDCLLPGQIKKLGAGTTFVTPRRPAKITALDCQSHGGEYVAYDQANSGSALKVWLAAAQEGDAVAQTYVGEIYEKGMGVEPDYTTAASWYKKAADQGDARAKLNLGYLFERGLGVERNIVAAMTLYREASGLRDTPIEFAGDVNITEIGSGAAELRELKVSLAQESEKVKDLRSRAEQTSSEVEAQRSQLENEAALLFAERAKLDKLKKNTASDRKTLQQTEQQLVLREQNLEKQRREIAQPGATSASTQVAAPTIALVGPSIELINPALISLRGSNETAVPQGTKTREVIGRVQAPAGMKAFTVNGNAQPLNDYGVFRVLLSLNEMRTPVRLLAVDQQGKSTNIAFSFVVGAETAVQTAAVSVSVDDNESHNYALVIGNNNYTQFPKLQTAQHDAETAAEMLSGRYGFQTTTLVNANRFTLLAALNRLSQKLTDKDNLLIYYAGHGEIDNKTKAGFWLPVDADLKDRRKWIPNSAVTDIVSALRAKRVLLIADSCYAGSLSRASLPSAESNLSEADRLTWLRAVAKSRSRLLLTSGGLKPVADTGGGDHSLFAAVFLQVLKDNNGVMEGQRLFREIAARVAVNPLAAQLGQMPQFAPIRHAGHESGEFFFMPRRAS